MIEALVFAAIGAAAMYFAIQRGVVPMGASSLTPGASSLTRGGSPAMSEESIVAAVVKALREPSPAAPTPAEELREMLAKPKG